MTWVSPETVTSMIEAHGITPDVTMTPGYEGRAGWPSLVPLTAMDALRGVGADRMPDQILDDLFARGLQDGPLQLGDPGTRFDRDTPRTELPPYIGPLGPVAGHVHEWGAMSADEPDDGPLEGPALAPYAPAAEDDEA
jgi:hypothetical protein